MLFSRSGIQKMAGKTKSGMYLTSYLLRIALFVLFVLVFSVGMLLIVKGIKTGSFLKLFS